MLSRRRFIAISAAVAPALALAGTDVHVETGIAMGATVTLRLRHPEAPALAALAMAELQRLEGVFSIYQPGSDLSRLNREGVLTAPPFELLECLSLAGAVHAACPAFDPSIQPLWAAEAMATGRGRPLSGAERAAAVALTGWSGVSLSPEVIRLRPGMALTLNGIAQGYAADRVAALLAGQGMADALIDTGEMVALSGMAWPVRLPEGEINLQGRALATSAPLGMTFGGDGQTSHIIDPATARPCRSGWKSVSIAAPTAAVADALSTAACLLTARAGIEALCDRFPGATLALARSL